MIKFVWRFLKEHLVDFIFTVVVVVCLWGASLLAPKITGGYIDSIVKGNITGESTKILIISFAVIGVVEFSTTFYAAYLKNKIANRLMLDIMMYMTSYVKKLPLTFFKKNDSTYLTQRINQDSWEMGSFITIVIISSAINVLSLIVISVYIFSIDISIGVKLAILIPIYLGLYKKFKTPMYSLMREQSERINRMLSSLNNQLLNVKVIKANSWFDLFDNDLKEKVNDAFKYILKNNLVQFLFYSSDLLINRIATIILVVYSGGLVLDGVMTIGDFTIINSYFVLAMQAVSGLIDFGSSYQKAKMSYDRIGEILAIKQEKNGEEIVDSISNIKIKDLTFSYDEGGRKILENFNYTFEKGKIYCILGENGRGKSTLTNLILGIYKANSGEILFDEKNVDNLNLYELRERLVGYIEQEPMLIQDTLRKNLTMNLKDINEEKFQSYIEKTGVNLILEKLENGLDTEISESGGNLSGGEKQRIIICRTLLKESDVIIMDEPTSALDKDSKERLATLLNEVKRDKIIIMITHDAEFKEVSDNMISL